MAKWENTCLGQSGKAYHDVTLKKKSKSCLNLNTKVRFRPNAHACIFSYQHWSYCYFCFLPFLAMLWSRCALVAWVDVLHLTKVSMHAQAVRYAFASDDAEPNLKLKVMLFKCWVKSSYEMSLNLLVSYSMLFAKNLQIAKRSFSDQIVKETCKAQSS